ncbi:zinc-ribbon domain-containing protein [Desulfovibrio mangrovi]|uniref:DUF3426 domain-containing protein n=1 Tax=Desulfovibrio mangrovi TaxID=2976983 RepID=UPI00224558B9|nr:DUF3426 domain-containing protein [Desulfovibrio mangrovi]UZP68474.1 zinc-ribbon domain-containing protein [Desulfovibrio mangrovi]
MHVTCPNCSTKYNLPDSMFKPGAKARCTVCKHMFPLAGEKAAPRAASPKDMGDDSIADLLGSSDSGFNLDAPSKKKPKEKGKSKLALVLVLLIVLLGGAGAGVYFMMPDLLGVGEKEAPTPAPNGTEDVAVTDNIKSLALRNVRQYYQPNEKVGQLFVVEGKVVNNFSTPKELVKVEVTLFDTNNVTITSKQQYCGITVSLFQLQVLGQQELESALNNKIEILTNNTNIAPGGEVPFMVVFYNPPASVSEFGVKVIEAKDPPKK